MSSQSERNYASAVQGIVLEKKMVAALKRLSIASLLPFDPDLPYTDTNVSLPSSSDDQYSPNSQNFTAIHPVSPTRNSPLNIPSSISHSPKTPPRAPLASPTDQNNTFVAADASDVPLTQLADDNKGDIFFDAPDPDLVIESSNSALWVPADFHPEIDPEMFKAHVKLTVDEIMLRNLRRRSMLSCGSAGSSPSLTSSHSRSTSNSPIKSNDVSPEKDLLPTSSKRLSASFSRYSNPSLRELTSELEILSQRAGMDAHDTVTLARTLSRSSLGYTDVELLAMDELQSPPSLTPHLQIYVDEIDTHPIQTSLVNVESPTRYKSHGNTPEALDPLQNTWRPNLGTHQDFGHTLEGSEASQAFALRRNRRPNFRKISTALGSTLQSSKNGKLAELRSELTNDYGGGLSATSPLPQRRRDPAARNSHSMFYYRESNGRANSEAPRTPLKQRPTQQDPRNPHDKFRAANGRPLQNYPMIAHGRPMEKESPNTHDRPYQSDQRSYPSHGLNSGPYAMASRSSPSLVTAPSHESGKPRPRLTYATDSPSHSAKYYEPTTPNARLPHGTNSPVQAAPHHLPVVQAQPNDQFATSGGATQSNRHHILQANTMGPQFFYRQPHHEQPHQKLSQSQLHATQHANDPSMSERSHSDGVSPRSFSSGDAALHSNLDANRRSPGPRLQRHNPIRTPNQHVPLPGLPGSDPVERGPQFVVKQSHKLNQNLDLLRSEINEFKERLTKTEAPPVDPTPSNPAKPASPTLSATDYSFDVSEPDVACETSFEIQPYLGELPIPSATSEPNSEIPAPVESPQAEAIVIDQDVFRKVPDSVDFEDAASHTSSEADFDPSQFTGTPSPDMDNFANIPASIDANPTEDLHDDSSPALEGKPSMESVPEDIDVASLETSPTKPRKRFGNMPNNVAKLHQEDSREPPAKIIKKKKSWLWLKDRSVSLDENSLSAESLRPSSRLVSSPAFSSNATKPLKPVLELAEKATRPKENMLAKFFKKKKATADATATEASQKPEAVTKSSKERKSDVSLESLKETNSEGLLGPLLAIKEKKSEGAFKSIKKKKSEGVIKPLREKKSRLFGNKKAHKDEGLASVNNGHLAKATHISADEDKENPSIIHVEASRPNLKKSTSQVDLASKTDDGATTETTKEPENGGVHVVEAEVVRVSTDSDEAEQEEVPLRASEVQDKLKKSIRRTSKANQPLEFTDSAFGFPLPPPSPSTLIMIDYRFPLHVERAIYRLSHLKLANPKRSLREQVLLSNFMYAYLNLVDHTLHIEQQMEKVSEDTPETVTLKKTGSSTQHGFSDTLKGLTDSDFGEEGMAEDEDFDDVMDGAYKNAFASTSGPASLV